MKNTKKLKQVLVTSTLLLGMLTISGSTSKAALQANPTTHSKPKSAAGSSWIQGIRNMETVGKTMGLTETLNGVEATSESNNIDVHMMLPTEFGAIAILSASGFGNPGKLVDESNVQKRTTTGNSTGIYYTGNRWEVLAAHSKATESKYIHNKLSKIGGVTNPPMSWHRRKDRSISKPI